MIYEILPVNNYCGNGSSTTFDFDFYIDSEDQLKVTYYDEDEIQTELTLNVDYTVNETKNENGSYITFPIDGSSYDVLGEDEKISIELTLPISQETQYNNSSLLNLEALEYSFDYLTRLIQIISRKIELCVQVAECSSTTPSELLELINTQAHSAQTNANSAAASLAQLNVLYNELLEIYSDINSNYEKFEKIDDIEETLDEKTDIDFSNITDNAKIICANCAMPSVTYISLTLGSTGTAYTAPADGWFLIRKRASAANQYLYLYGVNEDNTASTGGFETWSTDSNTHELLLPARKGGKVAVMYTFGGATAYFRFIYAQGSASEA